MTELLRERTALDGHAGERVEAAFVGPADAERGPGVVLVHAVHGVDAFALGTAERLAEAGYRVLVPDLYTREGLPVPAGTEQDPAPDPDPATIRAAELALPDRRALADLEGAAAALGARRDVDRRRIAVVGAGAGGTLAFLAGCTSTRFAAVVSFYGRVLYPELSAAKPAQPIEMLLNLDRPALLVFGERDASIPADEVELLRRGLEDASKRFELVTYPEAEHGFLDRLRPRYHEASARDAWQRTLRFLDEELG